MAIPDQMVRKTTRWLALLAAAVTPSLLTFAARAQENAAVPRLTVRPADPAEKGNGTLSAAAKAAIKYGPLPFSDATVAAKAAANRARDEVEKSGARRPFSPAERAPADAAGPGPLAPSLLLNVPGLTDNTGSPPRYHRRDRAHTLCSTGQLAGRHLQPHHRSTDRLGHAEPAGEHFRQREQLRRAGDLGPDNEPFLLHDGFDLLGQ
jgi:hypothetical protein